VPHSLFLQAWSHLYMHICIELNPQKTFNNNYITREFKLHTILKLASLTAWPAKNLFFHTYNKANQNLEVHGYNSNPSQTCILKFNYTRVVDAATEMLLVSTFISQHFQDSVYHYRYTLMMNEM